MKDFFYVNDVLHNLCLLDVARDAVEHERVNVRLECMRADGVIDARFPKLHGDLGGHELAFAGIFQKGLADGRARVNRAKDIAARAVEKTRNGAKDFALRAFAAARRAKDEI